MDSRRASISIMDLCVDAATVIETLADALKKAEVELAAAVEDIEKLVADVERIWTECDIDEADEELKWLCTRYCGHRCKAGLLCYEEGEHHACKNFRWRGRQEEGGEM